MSQRSSNAENGCENSKTRSSEISKKLLSDKEHNSLEFRSEIIPYDNSKDSNAPTLAHSGDNINLMFNIFKGSFKKMAVAAIGHIEQNSNFKILEKSPSSILLKPVSSICVKFSDSSDENPDCVWRSSKRTNVSNTESHKDKGTEKFKNKNLKIEKPQQYTFGKEQSGSTDKNDSLQLENIKESRDHSFENKSDSLEYFVLNDSLCNSENVCINASIQFENIESEETDSQSKLESSLCEFQGKDICETNENKAVGNICISGTMKNTSQKILENSGCLSETTIDTKLEPLRERFEEESLCRGILDTNSNATFAEKTFKGKLNTGDTILKKNLENSSEDKRELKISEVKSEKSDEIDLVEKVSEILQSQKKHTENKHESISPELKSSSSDGLKNEETENISEEIVECEVILSEISDPVESEPFNKAQKSSDKDYVVHSFECIDLVPDKADSEVKLLENNFTGNSDSFMNKTIHTFTKICESGDLESDDVKSVFSESDDTKDSEKLTSISKDLKKKQPESDARTRVQRRKVIATLTKDIISENAEVKNKTSGVRGTIRDISSKISSKTSPVGRNLRSKNLDATPQSSQGTDKKHSSVVETEEINVKARTKTPTRSSLRILARSATTALDSSSKIQSKKNNSAVKSQANLNSSTSTSKRSKRGT